MRAKLHTILHSVVCLSLIGYGCECFTIGGNIKYLPSWNNNNGEQQRSLSLTATTITQLEDPIRTNTVQPPPVSPATGLPNQIYVWRSHQVRYQVAHPTDTSQPSKGSVVLVHGLFVNSDHWRYTLKGLADAGYSAYAIDLLGSGYSSKPNPNDQRSRKLVCGESNGRFPTKEDGIRKDVTLGTANGGLRNGVNVDLLHPCESPYNFYTWSEQVADFTKEIVLKSASSTNNKVTLVGNSKGCLVALQSILDDPTLFNGAFLLNPNFRELHPAEMPFPKLMMPLLSRFQSILRHKGQNLFEALAKHDVVKQILMEPYVKSDVVDDVLVDVLLSPLLTPGASDVVFDTLSYSGGPLVEQVLRDDRFPKAKNEQVPVWVCYGKEDPWTPIPRIKRLKDIENVEKVVGIDGVGHCPHDEDPIAVNELLSKFLFDVEARIDIKHDTVPFFLKSL